MSLFDALVDDWAPPRSSPDRRKLTSQNVADMRRMYFHEGWSQALLAVEFGISQGHVSKVIRKLQWKDPK